MKLSELVTHTSNWVGIPRTVVESHARYLREADLLTSGGRGLAAPDMTTDDKITLLLAACGVEVASRSAEYVRVWLRSFRADPKRYATLDFAFLRADNIKTLLADLITKDLSGGPLDAWLKEAEVAQSKKLGRTKATDHTITLDFYVDEFKLELIVSRNEFSKNLAGSKDGVRITSHPISVKFMPPPPPLGISAPPRLTQSFSASSHLIRRLTGQNLVGWGQCLQQ